jgi:hypothetical protein
MIKNADILGKFEDDFISNAPALSLQEKFNLLDAIGVDVAYIEKWLRELDTATDKNSFLATFRMLLNNER